MFLQRIARGNQSKNFIFVRRTLATKLVGADRENYVSEIAATGWKVQSDRDAVEKTFEFLNFSQAWSFMSRSALLAEKMDHHPEWFNVYNRVEVTLSTHDCGGISSNDIEMAQAMDRFAADLVR
eukprot:g1624.t1